MMSIKELGRQVQACPQISIREGLIKTRAEINERKKRSKSSMKKSYFTYATDELLARVVYMEFIYSIDSNK